MDAERGRLERAYPGFAEFERGFEVADDVLERLVALGRERGAASDGAGFDASWMPVCRHLKALVAQRLFGTEAFYRAMHRADDPAFARAMALLGDWEREGAPLLRPDDADE